MYIFYLSITIWFFSYFDDYCTCIDIVISPYSFSRNIQILLVAAIMCLLMLEGELSSYKVDNVY